MKKYILVTLLITGFLGGAFAQDSLTTNPPKRKSLALLYGSSDLWYQNYLSRRDYLQTYTHFGLQYAVEVKKNVDVYATLLYGAKDVKKVASAGLGLRYYLLDRESHDKFRPFANFSGEVMMDNSTPTTFSDVDFTGSIGTGFDFKIVGSLYGRAMMNVGFPFFQIGQVDFTDGRGTYTHYTAGIVYEWGNKPKKAAVKVQELSIMDTDGDGIVDKEDKCPSVKGVKENNGCPADSDGDGIVDVEDKCPTVAGVRSTNGCPVDTDGDGIIDSEDRCPSVAGIKANQGCPVDTDGDGIIDSEDRCPTVAGVNANQGCPADSDGDGIIDTEDACPSVAGISSLKGCPAPVDTDADGVADQDDLMPTVPGSAELQGVPVHKVIYFETDEFALTPESITTLEALVTVLKSQSNLKVKLTGHTDSRQSVQYNVKLSKNRVFETRKYLIKNRVDAKRMKLSWFSELVPAAPNKTVDGMKLNRRVELQIVK